MIDTTKTNAVQIEKERPVRSSRPDRSEPTPWNGIAAKPPGQQERDLPAGWRWVRLGEVVEIHPGQHIMEADYNYVGNGVGYLTGPADFGVTMAIISKWTANPKAFAEPGDVLVTVKGAGVGKVNLAPAEKAAIGRQLMALRPLPGALTRDFLYLFTRTQLTVLSGQALGATVPGLGRENLASLLLPLPPLSEQRRIAARLIEQLAAVERARAAAQAQLEAARALQFAYVRAAMLSTEMETRRLADCLTEVAHGVGSSWDRYPVLGATRAGLAPAKEPVGKSPERYKLVDAGTVFYNPMRIMIGSIALVDQGDPVGITSPDYVVVKTKPQVLHHVWFYHWLRSSFGEQFIHSLARGAVRERMLFRRLATGRIEMPPWTAQLEAADKIRSVRPVIGALEAQLAAIAALPAALLRRAFAGET